MKKLSRLQFSSEKNKLTHMGSEIGCRIQKNKFQTPIQSITWFKFDLHSKKTPKITDFPISPPSILKFQLKVFLRKTICMRRKLFFKKKKPLANYKISWLIFKYFFSFFFKNLKNILVRLNLGRFFSFFQ